MLHFDASVYALPDEAAEGPVIELGGTSVPTLTISHGSVGRPMIRSFEEAADVLTAIEGVYFEPDGYFVWGHGAGDARWQIDGHLYDRNEKLLYVDLRGRAPQEAFDRVLRCTGWPAMSVMFALRREAVYLREEAFRRWAAAGPTS